MKREDIRSVAHGLLHHARSAIAVTLCVFILDSLGLLKFLDSLTLRAALAARTDVVATPDDYDQAWRNEPVILAVDSLGFETAFGQRSPLDRGVLAEIVSEIAARQPRLIAIDLDLSPGPDGGGTDGADAALKAVLTEIADGGRTILVLTTPTGVATDSLIQKKQQWMADLCTSGVRFAYADVLLSQSFVLRFDASLPVLSRVAAASIGRRPPKTDQYDTLEPCALALQGPAATVFLSDAFTLDQAIDASRFERQLPLDPTVLKRTLTRLRPLSSPGDHQNYVGLRGKDVFLGATFSQSDRFRTALGAQPGLVLHAATFSALISPPHPLGRLPALGFDLVVSFILMILFERSWRLFAGARHLPSRTIPIPDCRWLATRGALALNLLLLIATLWLAIQASDALLDRGWWLAPSAIVLGVFIESMSAGRSQLLETGHPATTQPLRPTRDFLWDVVLLVILAYLANTL